MYVRVEKSCGRQPVPVNKNGERVNINYQGNIFCRACLWPLFVHNNEHKHVEIGEFETRGGFFSSYELVAFNYLKKRGDIKDLQPQYIIPEHNEKSYDFYFTRNGKKYLLEIDGEQHFEDGHFDRTASEQKKRDIHHTNLARDLGYKIIRIDYSNIPTIDYHFERLFKQPSRNYYLSSVYKYLHMGI